MGYHAEPKMYNLDGVWVTRKQIEEMIDRGKLVKKGTLGDEIIYGTAYDGSLLYLFNRGIVKPTFDGWIRYNGNTYRVNDIKWVENE